MNEPVDNSYPPANSYPTVMGTNVVSQIPYEGINRDLWLFIMSRAAIIEDFKHQLKGEILVIEDEKQIYKKIGTALMNDIGIEWVISQISQYLAIDKISTDLTESEVNRMTYLVSKDVADNLHENYKKFDVKKSDLSPIVHTVENFVFSNLTASRNGTLLNFIKPTMKREETYQPLKEKGGLFGWVPSLRG